MFQSNVSTLITLSVICYLLSSYCTLSVEAQGSSDSSDETPQVSSMSLMLTDNDGLSRLLASRLQQQNTKTAYDEGRMATKRNSHRMMSERLPSAPQVGAVEGDGDDEESQLHHQRNKASKQKVALKKRWHKLVDDLIEREFSTNEKPRKESERFNAISIKSDSKRKKWTTGGSDGGEKIMILLKRPPGLSEEEVEEGQKGSVDSQVPQTNGFNLMNTINQFDAPLQKVAAVGRRPTNVDEHARRVIDDKFGIMKDSIFTTNNHLGLKGVPKFGSEEEY